MTVAAVILSASTEGAIADTLGQPRVRRLADLAWSGGALPVVVVAADPDGDVAKALLGSEAVPGPPPRRKPARPARCCAAPTWRMAEVHDTTAVLLWPARLAWVGPETITTLIEAHGLDASAMLRPAWHGEPGWPVLLPTEHLAALRAVAPTRMPPDVIEDLVAAIPSRVVEVGDPGVTHDVDTPRDDCRLRGPARPARRPYPRMGRRRGGRSRPARIRGVQPRSPAGSRRRPPQIAAHRDRGDGDAADDQRDSERLGRRRRLADQHARQADGDDRLGEQDDARDDRRQARQRDRDSR